MYAITSMLNQPADMSPVEFQKKKRKFLRMTTSWWKIGYRAYTNHEALLNNELGLFCLWATLNGCIFFDTLFARDIFLHNDLKRNDTCFGTGGRAYGSVWARTEKVPLMAMEAIYVNELKRQPTYERWQPGRKLILK